MSEVVNLTPHPIVIRLGVDEKSDVTFPPAGVVARVTEKANKPTRNHIFGFPVAGKAAFDEVVNLPEPKEGVIYIVSGLVAQNVSRSDVFSPATGPEDNAIRNEKGHIVAVTKLKETV